MPRAAGSVIARVTVASVTRLTPSFTRIEFGSPALAEFGVQKAYFDQRISLLFPPPGGTVPDLESASGNWYQEWRELPDAERGSLRTYSVRDVLGVGAGTRVVVDFVLHGSTGPASEWAGRARVGDELVLVGPRRGEKAAGIEFASGHAETLLIAGDETAVPAISRILADLGADARGHVFLEVPAESDVLPLVVPAEMGVHWLARDGAEHGTKLVASITAHLGHRLAAPAVVSTIHPPIWETPTYSSSGETSAGTAGVPGLYAWIAGEAATVTALRRLLVGGVGLARDQVAFMGYWRRGVSAGG